MRTRQLRIPSGRLITVVIDGQQLTHVAYGDLCQNLPASWRDSLPRSQRRPMFYRIFAEVSDLKQLTTTDRIDKKARNALEELLDNLHKILNEQTHDQQEKK
ncbi:hypothetical protein I6H52_04610 [Corynebacterium urealyticum]|uniref:hypothetical protein n=1 Tax=Corynebacterium TaxID=1716 RepID=UPI0008A19E77|nr:MULTISPECIES: hypothetical protein [Corynebacterium]OFO13395.1 hypothetical protein HMPREF3088_05605 [Corynebacterium sp. HMSC22B11]QQE51621.1 hypothetical protein I6H52_04610 [Corynebacterium urealyticum]